ncbi:efflux RND transporter permease subunit, partial [Bacillus sp. SIMBA_154]|uniref:efflux RND transporter permease subunit n=1 Tax=Bacillus sp. SIMBA_154 TaxID=3080859 RepID=UPI003977E59F
MFLSTFTSVVCLLPILFINEIESSLFYDLAIVLVTGLSVSYLISISLTPALIQLLSKRRRYKGILKQHQ